LPYTLRSDQRSPMTTKAPKVPFTYAVAKGHLLLLRHQRCPYITIRAHRAPITIKHRHYTSALKRHPLLLITKSWGHNGHSRSLVTTMEILIFSHKNPSYTLGGCTPCLPYGSTPPARATLSPRGFLVPFSFGNGGNTSCYRHDTTYTFF
jgi:hypothetical protein